MNGIAFNPKPAAQADRRSADLFGRYLARNPSVERKAGPQYVKRTDVSFLIRPFSIRRTATFEEIG